MRLHESPAALAQEPPCRPAMTGEMVINEILVRPAGLDVDGDAKSSSRDEYIEVVSRANVPVHLRGVELWWDGARRGRITSSACLPPRQAGVVVGSSTTEPKLPPGATWFRLDKTLRLSDASAKLRLTGLAGGDLDHVDIPPPPKSSGVVNWTRRIDGDWFSDLAEHSEVSSRPSSPGRCQDGSVFPACMDWLQRRARDLERER